jgi:hypothetical protein
MGKLTEMMIANTDLPLDHKVAWHLQGNHYPPIPLIMVEVCVEAIELARLGNYTAEIKLPTSQGKYGEPFQITWQGQDTAPVSAIIEAHHLDGFINTDTEQDGEV